MLLLSESPEKISVWQSLLESTLSVEEAPQKTLPLVAEKNFAAFPHGPEMELWLIRSGLSSLGNLPASQIGLYTDFS